MRIEELIKQEIEKTQKKIEKLKVELEKCDKEARSPKECPLCKTKNYHYYPQINTWCCACC